MIKQFRIAFVGESGVDTVGDANVGACSISEHDERAECAAAARAYIDENCSRDHEVYEKRYQRAMRRLTTFENSGDDCCIMRIDYGALVIVS